MKILSNPRTIVFILSANFIVLISLFIWFYSQYSTAKNSEAVCNSEFLTKTLINNILPRYEFIDSNGNDQYENLNKGKILLVFLRSDCPACQKDVAFISEHFSEITGQMRIVGITTENNDKIDAFIKEYGLQFPIFTDKNGDMMLKARVMCTPTNFILENGFIKSIIFGKLNNLEELNKSL